MGESLNSHETKDLTLNQIEMSGIVSLRHGMNREETLLLQMALAVHLYLLEHDEADLISNIDFLHPWGEGHVDRRSVMNNWVGDFTEGTKAAKFTNFIENIPEGIPVETIHLKDRREREILLQRMGIDIPKEEDKTIH